MKCQRVKILLVTRSCEFGINLGADTARKSQNTVVRVTCTQFNIGDQYYRQLCKLTAELTPK